jgi:dihydrofolate reductase
MKVSLIVAMDKSRGIGKNNDLMWHLPADMKFFKETTTGHIVVMGRKNFESIPSRFRPLPNRENVILTHNQEFQAEGCSIFHSLESVLDAYRTDDRIVYIIGGGQIYKAALDLNVLDEMIITHVDGEYDADTFFPTFEASHWLKEEIFSFSKDEKNEAGFTVFKYIRK